MALGPVSQNARFRPDSGAPNREALTPHPEISKVVNGKTQAPGTGTTRVERSLPKFPRLLVTFFVVSDVSA